MHSPIILLALATGCRTDPPFEPTSPPTVVDEARAVALARDVVATNDDWVDRATFEAKRDGSGWSVLVRREPRIPGGHRLVLIDENGTVTKYLRGM